MKIIMTLNGKEYTSKNDWDSLRDFLASEDEFDGDPDYDAGGSCEYELEKPFVPVGANIRKTRESAGMTQTELAEKSGIDQRQISRYENGQVCGYDILIAIARALGVEPGDLLR